MAKELLGRFAVEVPIYQTERTKQENGGETFRKWQTGTETRFVDVYVDAADLARSMGVKAVRSKGGKAVEASGRVEVRRVGGR